MNERLILGLTGFSGSGKTSNASWLANAYGFTLFEGSTSIAREASRQGLTLGSRNDYEAFYRKTQQEISPDWLAQEMLSCPGDRIAQVGLRSRADFRRIREASGLVIAFVCPETICFNRLDTSLAKNASTLEEYRAQKLIESQPDEAGSSTDWAIDNADYQVDTSQDTEQVHTELSRIIAERLV